jgi:lysozyme
MTLLQRIILHEGLSLKPYKDTLGFWTIGYGHKILPSETFDKITEDEAMDILMTDVEIAKMQLAKTFPWVLGLDDIRREILVEMVFQLGLGGVGKFKKMLNALREKDFDTASREMLNSLWYKQTPKRCKELSELMRTGG